MRLWRPPLRAPGFDVAVHIETARLYIQRNNVAIAQ
jgi:hypothetical protein